MNKWVWLVVFVFALVLATYLVFEPDSRKQSESVSTPNLAIIAPHHDIAKQDRLAQWQTLHGLDKITKVFIVSPNHFAENQKTIITGNENLTTARGELEVTAMPNVVVDNDQISVDHGILSMIGEVRQFAPNAKLTPLMIGDDANTSGLADSIVGMCPNSCLVIASVDFTHYEPAEISKVQDSETLKYLENMNIEQRPKTEVVWTDSPKTLELVQSYAKANGFKWYLYKADYSPETSHILGEYRL